MFLFLLPCLQLHDGNDHHLVNECDDYPSFFKSFVTPSIAYFHVRYTVSNPVLLWLCLPVFKTCNASFKSRSSFFSSSSACFVKRYLPSSMCLRISFFNCGSLR